MIFIIVITTLSLDQLTKFLAAKYLLLSQSHPVIKGVFHLSLIHNRGAAFGILKGHLSLFIIASLFAIAMIYAGIKDSRHSKIYRVSLGLILAGALGNLIDRVSYGYVIDFLDFRIWPVFNVADSAITIGAVLLGWFILKGK